MTINEIQDQIIEEFSVFTDWMDKYSYLIDLGKDLPAIDNTEKNDKHLINGCQSRVWVSAKLDDGKVIYNADSDAVITKGIISLLVRTYSGHTPDEILHSNLYFIDQIGLKENLSPTRANGLLAMIKQMQLYAFALKTQQNE